MGSHLVLAGVGDHVLGQLEGTGALDTLGSDNVFPATPDVGESLTLAVERARMLQGGGEGSGERPAPTAAPWH